MICLLCEERIFSDDLLGTAIWHDGVLRQTHRECSLRSVLGGIGHHLDHGYWCIGKGDPDAGMTYRQSAKAVWRMVQRWARAEDVVDIVTTNGGSK